MPWRPFGTKIGDAYQVADDILDVQGTEWALGKPVGQDKTLGRPNAVAQHGLDQAHRMLRQNLEAACDIIPTCSTKVPVIAWVGRVSSRIDEALQASLGESKVG